MTRKTRTNPLTDAVRAGDLARLEALLKAGESIEEADIHGFKGLPLRTACFSGNHAIIKTLLDHGANPNALASDGPAAPLRAAIRAGHHGIVRLLIERGSDVPLGLKLPLGIDLPADQMLPPNEAFLPIYQPEKPAAAPAEPEPRPANDNTLDFTPTFAVPDIEEVDIKACRGVDTRILSIELAESLADPSTDRITETGQNPAPKTPNK